MRILDKIDLIKFELNKRQVENVKINNRDNPIIDTKHWLNDED